MERIEEELPSGAVPSWDLCAGSVVAHADEGGRVKTTRMDGKGDGPTRRFVCPTFLATKKERDMVEARVRSAAPAAKELRVTRCSRADHNGVARWAVFAAEEPDAPWTAG